MAWRDRLRDATPIGTAVVSLLILPLGFHGGDAPMAMAVLVSGALAATMLMVCRSLGDRRFQVYFAIVAGTDLGLAALVRWHG